MTERNRLAHQYFGHWDAIWVDEQTNTKMVDDVDQIRILFEGTAARLMPILSAHLDTIGADPDSFIPGLGSRIAEQLADNTDLA